MTQVLRSKVSWMLTLLVMLIVADTAWTIYVVHTHMATEANPLMEYLVNHNIPAFVAIKLLCPVAIAVVLSHFRMSQPKRADFWAHIALWGFIALYLFGSIGVNFPQILR